MGWKQGRTRQCRMQGVRKGHGVVISARAPHTLPGESYQARSTCSRHLAALGALNESHREASLPHQPPAVVGLPDHLHDHPAVQRELVCLLRLVGPHNEIEAAWRERGKDVSAFWRESCGKRTRKVGLNFAHLHNPRLGETFQGPFFEGGMWCGPEPRAAAWVPGAQADLPSSFELKASWMSSWTSISSRYEAGNQANCLSAFSTSHQPAANSKREFVTYERQRGDPKILM